MSALRCQPWVRVLLGVVVLALSTQAQDPRTTGASRSAQASAADAQRVELLAQEFRSHTRLSSGSDASQAAPRVAALVVWEGRVIWSAASGLAAPDGDAISTEHLFDLGSVSKHITAAAVLRLVDRGKLELDTSLGELFDDLPEYAEALSVRQLLGHLAGLPAAAATLDDEITQRDRVVQLLLRLAEPDRSPEGSFAYSNLGYHLAAAVVEEVSGKRFEAFVEDELFRRAKLKHAVLVGGSLPARKLGVRRISALFRKASALEEFPSGWGRKGATGVLMSVADMARWDAALRDGDVLSDASRELWAQAGPGGYGLGWFVEQGGELGVRLQHGGSVEGFHSWLLRWPESAAMIVVLGDERVNAEALGYGLEGALVDDRFLGVRYERGDAAVEFARAQARDSTGALVIAPPSEWVSTHGDHGVTLLVPGSAPAPKLAASLSLWRPMPELLLAELDRVLPLLDPEAPDSFRCVLRHGLRSQLHDDQVVSLGLSPRLGPVSAGDATLSLRFRRAAELPMLGLELSHAHALALRALLAEPQGSVSDVRPAPTAASADVGVRPDAFTREPAGWSLLPQGAWSWPVLRGDVERLHGFVRAHPDDRLPAAFLNVEPSAARAWAGALRELQALLDPDAPKRHRVAVEPADGLKDPGLWAQLDELVPFVETAEAGAPLGRCGLQRTDGERVLTLEFSAGELDAFVTALEAALPASD